MTIISGLINDQFLALRGEASEQNACTLALNFLRLLQLVLRALKYRKNLIFLPTHPLPKESLS